jgi:hypothetical protein
MNLLVSLSNPKFARRALQSIANFGFGTLAAPMRCPFCFSEKAAEAPVCPTCHRDTEIPAALRKEHEDLVRMRDRLREELADKEAKLHSRRFWPVRVRGTSA